MKPSIAILCSIIIGLVTSKGVAQDQTPTPKHLMREDSAAVNALVMYPDTIRLHIFEACEYPASIVSMATLQKNTSSDFASFISGYSKEEQEDFWNLSRYPSLVSKLVQGGKKSADEINSILLDYPADIHDDALKYGVDYYDQLQKMDEMQAQSDAQFEQILVDYPQVTQDALRDIVQYPEIINLLNDHLSLAVRVGDHFRRNPQGVIHRADSLNLAQTRQNAENAGAWKQTLEQNPDEENDLKEAATDYATENGYTQEDISATPNPDQVTNYTCRPYSYWFGYPAWYPYSYWYPYPYWFDCGFYHDRSGKIVVFGTPSYYFTNWYFYHPEHWNHYPHLANAYVDHYYGPHRTVGANTLIVHNWVHENQDYLPKDFVNNNSRRTEAIRQLGKLNVDVQKQKGGGKSVSPAVRDQYLQNNRSQYPALNADRNTKAVRDVKQPNTPQVIQQPVKLPPVRIAREMNQPITNTRETPAPPVRDVRQTPVPPVPNSRETPTPRVTDTRPPPAPPIPNPRETPPTPVTNTRQLPARPAYNFNQINKAQEYHRSVWDQTQPVVRPQPPQPPRPQAQQPVRQEPAKRQPEEKRKQ